ncbi:hypothetical protein ETD83_21640 [Actinomadura soli]|uniref:Lipoprotein n=1 Tax=Actinomadura soli TaxID=2508997 RepID=A0A5C4JB64_9ACTN|nr:hypothetical protein [Actinomadura soli]TMQ96174.1 hypothetical protein ETD83_21640 [Actinomadura soli]
MRLLWLLASGAAAVITGCSTSAGSGGESSPLTTRQATASIHGTYDAIEWRVDIIEKDSVLCTRSVVQGRPQSFDCPPAVDDGLPLNFSVDSAYDRMDLIFGVAASKVVELLATTKDRQRFRPELKNVGGLKFFAYAVRAGTALDLIAKDSRGAEIASGHDKLAESG